MNKWGFIKLNIFWMVDEIIKKMKRPPIEGEKVFASGTYNKE